MALTVDHLLLRRTGITASQVAAVFKVSKWASPLSVYSDKICTDEPVLSEQTKFTERGSVMESSIAASYALERDIDIEGPLGTMVKCYDCQRRFEPQLGNAQLYESHRPSIRSYALDPKCPYCGSREVWMIATPDYKVIATPEDYGIEVKSVYWWAADGWGPSGSDKIPPDPFFQGVWQMAVMDWPMIDYPVFIGSDDLFDTIVAALKYGMPDENVVPLILERDFRIFRLERDLDRERKVVSRVRDFWHNNVLAHSMPAATGLASDKEVLQEIFPEDKLDMFQAEPQHINLVDQHAELKEVYDSAELEFNEIKNQLRQIIGDHEGFYGDGFKVTHKRGSDTIGTDWEMVANDLSEILVRLYPKAKDVLGQLAAKHVVTLRYGSRRLKVTDKR